MRVFFRHLEGPRCLLILIAGLASIHLVFGCVAVIAQTTGTIVGTVRDNRSRNPRGNGHDYRYRDGNFRKIHDG
jgi:hypothetical protein